MRHPQLLCVETSQLLIVDLQVKLLPVIHDWEGLLHRAGNFIAAARIMGIPASLTQQYTRGLGPTHSQIMTVVGDCQPLEKLAFSACGCGEVTERLERIGRKQVLLVGIEAHVCVQQTALDLLHGGYRPYVLADGVGSRRPFDAETALARMRQAGVIITTTEAAAFELLIRAGTETFKNVLPLFK